MTAEQPIVRALAIGGVDPTCGAGTVLDAFVFAALGFAPATVVTTLTAQNTTSFMAARAVDTELVADQLRAVAESPFRCIKVGALGSGANARAIARYLSVERGVATPPPLVIDPVLLSSTGGALVPAIDLPAYDELCQSASVATPNADEATLLSGVRVSGPDSAEQAARALSQRWGCAVVVTGVRCGDADVFSEAVDVLVADGKATHLRHVRVESGEDTRGTGCAYAAALAVALASGPELPVAIGFAQRVVARVVGSARMIGSGRAQADLTNLTHAVREGLEPEARR